MKRIKIAILTTVVVSCMVFNSSCKKNLEELPYSSLSSSDVFNNEDGLKKATLGIYQTYIENWTNTWYRFGASETGHKYATMGQFGDYFNSHNQFATTSSNNTGLQLAAIWTEDYKMIARANTVIANALVAVPDAAIANKYIAEARFLRGYMYFDLARNFGGVPIVDKQITSLSQTDLIYGKRATLQETYDFLMADMLFAASNLPDKWTGADAGRISAGASKAMLGKVYLTMAGKPLNNTVYYQKAVDMLTEVVGTTAEAKYGFGLQAKFTDVFSSNNKKNSEVVLVFGNFYSSINQNASIWPFFLGGRGLVNNSEQSQAGLTYKYYQLFEPTDDRRDFTCVIQYKAAGNADLALAGDNIVYDPVKLKYIVQRTGATFGNATINQGIVYGKFDRTPRADGAVPWAYPIDMIQLRFSDVLLCLAEALNETGKPGEALTLLNRVRTRSHAGAYLDADNMVNKIRLERRLELAGEFTTVYDIRRWGTLQEEIAAEVPSQVIGGVVGTYNARLELYPIPQRELDKNVNLARNPGYN